MTVDHIAIYVKDLEEAKNFYIKYFNATANKKYTNPNTKLETYFLSFENGTRIEIMNRPNLEDKLRNNLSFGLIHIAFKVGSKSGVEALTNKIEADGYNVVSKPRTSGDGYYESCVSDSDGNLIEIVA